jgi:hypothetical protein
VLYLYATNNSQFNPPGGVVKHDTWAWKTACVGTGESGPGALKPVAFSRVYCKNIVTFVPSNSEDPAAQVNDCGKRLASLNYMPNKVGQWAMRKVARDFIARFPEETEPFEPSYHLSSRAWLESRKYNQVKKQALWQELQEFKCNLRELVEKKVPAVYRKACNTREKYWPMLAVVQSFTKFEFLKKVDKFGRIINGRLRLKAYFGPLIHAIEGRLYKILQESGFPLFKKELNSEALMDVMEGYCNLPEHVRKYMGDARTWEAQQFEEYKAAGVWQVYWYMCRNNAKMMVRMRIFILVVSGLNVLVSKYGVQMIRALMCSGEMDTSLGNGLSNLFSWQAAYLVRYGEVPRQEMIITVEGDDAIVACDRQITQGMFENIGIHMEVDECNEANTMSFCGQVYERSSRTLITDPMPLIISFGWLDIRKANLGKNKVHQLYRLVAMSYLYLYPGCPIVQEFSLFVLRATRGQQFSQFVLDTMNVYEREIYEQFKDTRWQDLVRPITEETRELMFEQFGITPRDQAAAELQFKGMTVLEPFELHYDSLYRDIWANNWDDNVGIECLDVLGRTDHGGVLPHLRPYRISRRKRRLRTA